MLLRSDEDREINHHGRPVEVGEEDTRPGSSSDKVERKTYLLFWCLQEVFSPKQEQVVPFSEKDLVAVNEKVQLEALKSYYDRWEDLVDIRKNSHDMQKKPTVNSFQH